MKSKIMALFIAGSFFITGASSPLLAQQGYPMIPMNPQAFGIFGQGQAPSSYPGLQNLGPVFQPPQMPGYYPGDQEVNRPLSDRSKAGQRYCGPASSIAQPLYQAPFPQVQKPPQTTPVQSPWPGSPAEPVQETGTFQQVGTDEGLPERENITARDLELLKERLAKLEKLEKGKPSKRAQEEQEAIQKFSRRSTNPNPPPVFYEAPSAIEASFQQLPSFQTTNASAPAPRNVLRQYGYHLFASPVSTFAPVMDVPVGPDYILGPGDDLFINVWGAMDSGVVRTVDRNGQIVLPSVGPLRVWGLTFSQAERLIRDQLTRSYPGFQTSVTMGKLRTIRVYVVGEVCQPGSFTISSLSTVTNALFAAGGPLKLGSLRNIQLKRNHHDVGTVDLYDFLLKGDKTRDFRLESGDTIFVPPIGPVAAVEGEIKRPGIYELKGEARVTDLIQMAGGVMPQSYLRRVQIIRTKFNAEREVIDLDLSSFGMNGDAPRNIELRNGDLVKIYPTDPRIYNTVTLNGAVKHPGEYELKSEMRLSDLLRRELTLPEAYLKRVEIARLKDDLTTEVIQVNLEKAWGGEGTHDVLLRPRDQITVRTEYRTPWKVMLGGEVKRPGIYTIQQGDRLSSVIKRAGGFTDKAFLKGAVFTRATVREMEKKRLDEFVRAQEQRLFGELIREGASQQAVMVQAREHIELLASKVTLGRVVIQLDDLDKLEGSQSDLILEDGDALNVPQKPATVMVMGSVRNPTSVLHKDEMDVQYYLNRAGGLTPDADNKGIYLLKADGSAITGFMRLRSIEPGDVIIAPPSTEARIQWLPLLKDLATVAGQVAVGLAGLAAIF